MIRSPGELTAMHACTIGVAKTATTKMITEVTRAFAYLLLQYLMITNVTKEVGKCDICSK
jgi:hypothetical protein